MEVKTTTREITDYHFSLSEADLAAMLADPIAWADNLRAELNYQTPLAPTPPPAAKRTPAKRRGAGEGATKRGPKASSRKSPAGAGLQKIQCQSCDRQIAAKFFPRHMAKAHPDVASYPTPTSSAD